jgi:hypothetical protein
MQFATTPVAPKIQNVQSPRELNLDELALVCGGLPRGGWLEAGAPGQSAAMGIEPLPRGGW